MSAVVSVHRLARAAALSGGYVLLVDSFTAWDWALGALLGVGLTRSAPARRPASPFALLRLLWAILANVVSGTWKTSRLVLGLGKRFRPGVLRVRLPDATPGGLAFFGLVQSLAPGSALIALDQRERELLFHVLGAEPLEHLRADLERFYDRYQQPVLP